MVQQKIHRKWRKKNGRACDQEKIGVKVLSEGMSDWKRGGGWIDLWTAVVIKTVSTSKKRTTASLSSRTSLSGSPRFPRVLYIYISIGIYVGKKIYQLKWRLRERANGETPIVCAILGLFTSFFFFSK